MTRSGHAANNYLITSSARSRDDSGIINLGAFMVLRLMVTPKLVAFWALKTRSTNQLDGRIRLDRRKSARTTDPNGSIRLSQFGIRPSIGTENFIPEEMDHRVIAVRVPVMSEVQFLFPSEPRKPLKSRSLYVIFLVKKDVRVKRRGARNNQNDEKIAWQDDVCKRSDKKHRNEKEGRIIAFVSEVCL
jgi:hypothetical protein